MTTIQLTLNEDDIHALELVLMFESTSEPMLVALAKHIVEQVQLVEAINFGKALADMTLEEDKQFQARLDSIPHKE
jgi:hypothetical protein